MQRLRVGQRICSNRFEIVSLLGAGGSGEVYLARDHQDESSDKQVALKVYLISHPKMHPSSNFMLASNAKQRPLRRFITTEW